MVEKRFVIPVERRWTLLILPILALLYFLFIVTLAALDFEVKGVPMDYLVLSGAGFFGLVLLIELPFLLKRRVRMDDDAAEAVGATEVEPLVAAAPEESVYAAPVAPVRERDDEYRTMDESAQGLRVLEYSKPAKSRNRGSVYAKTMVPVTKEHVLRIETLAAEPHDL